MTLGEAGRLYAVEAEAIGKRSIGWRYQIREFLAYFGPEAELQDVASRRSVTAYLSSLKARGLASQTILMRLCHLRCLTRMATIDDPNAAPMPFPDHLLKINVNNARTRVLDSKEWQALDKVMAPVDMDIVLGFYFSGCRSLELWALETSDINMEANTMFIRRRKCGPGIVLEMHDFVRGLAAQAIAEGRRYVLNPTGTRSDSRKAVAQSWTKRHFRPALAQANIKGFKAHMGLRACFASALDAAGVSIAIISSLMGHASWDQTAHYITTAKRTIKRSLDHLDAPSPRTPRPPAPARR